LQILLSCPDKFFGYGLKGHLHRTAFGAVQV
jgi:hypothetical protein